MCIRDRKAWFENCRSRITLLLFRYFSNTIHMDYMIRKRSLVIRLPSILIHDGKKWKKSREELRWGLSLLTSLSRPWQFAYFRVRCQLADRDRQSDKKSAEFLEEKLVFLLKKRRNSLFIRLINKDVIVKFILDKLSAFYACMWFHTPWEARTEFPIHLESPDTVTVIRDWLHQDYLIL